MFAVCTTLVGCGSSTMSTETVPPDTASIYGDTFSLTDNGKQAVQPVLAAVGLPELATLRAFGGTGEMTKKLCETVYRTYNEQNKTTLSDERCGWNLQADTQTFEAYGNPLVVLLKDLDGRYLFLLIDEEGLGGTRMFTYVYDIQKQTGQTFARESISNGGGQEIFYENGLLQFYSHEGPCIPETDSCAPQKEATYDPATGALTFEPQGE